MRPPSEWTGATTRSVAAVLAVALLVSTAGCAGIMSSGGGASTSAQLDSVPAESDTLAFVDLGAMLDDDTLRGVVNTYYEELNASSPYYSGPTSVDTIVSQAENESGLSASQFETMTLFSKASKQADASSDEFNGFIVTSALSKSDLETALTNQSGTPFSTETYKETTLWVPEETGIGTAADVIGWLGDGTFVSGTESAVKAAVDVRAGDADAVSGDLRETFETTRDGYAKFAMNVPQQQVDPGQYGNSQYDLESLNSVQTVSGALYVESSDIGLATHLVTNSSSDASDVGNVAQGVVSLYSGLMTDETAKATFDEIEVTTEGSTVTISYENAASDIEDAIEALYNESSL